jgi:GntR family transcriptional repressor for pyruvate dehydrogenase complex
VGDQGLGRRRGRIKEKPELIADELRTLIVTGQLSEGDSLGKEPELVERFGVSRPSLREALRILETEGLVTVVRGVLGGIIVHEPDEKLTARMAALVLQSRNVTLADVYQARSFIEPEAVRLLASSSLAVRNAALAELAELVREEKRVIDDPDAFGAANARFHERLVALAGNQTLSIVVEMLHEVVERAVTSVSRVSPDVDSAAVRRRGIRSQEALLELIESKRWSEAEEHWRSHMIEVGKVMLRGQQATTVVDLLHHY